MAFRAPVPRYRCYNARMSSQSTDQPSNVHTTPELTATGMAASRARERQTRTLVVGAIVAGVVLIAILVLAVYVLLQPGTPTERWRDIFIIMVALELLVIGVRTSRSPDPVGQPHQPAAERASSHPGRHERDREYPPGNRCISW